MNPIAVENARVGTSAWQLERPATQHEIEGYKLRPHGRFAAAEASRRERLSIWMLIAVSGAHERFRVIASYSILNEEAP